jgi:hypothetical protein
VAVWYILWPFGIFCGHLVYFTKKNLAILWLSQLLKEEAKFFSRMSLLTSSPQGDQMREKVAQSVAQSISCEKITHNFTVEKSSPIICAYSVIFTKTIPSKHAKICQIWSPCRSLSMQG